MGGGGGGAGGGRGLGSRQSSSLKRPTATGTSKVSAQATARKKGAVGGQGAAGSKRRGVLTCIDHFRQGASYIIYSSDFLLCPHYISRYFMETI